MMKQFEERPVHFALALALVASISATPGYAQSAEDGEDEGTIIVTARKTEEKLSDVPLAISALNAQQLQETGARGLEDVSRLSPGFSFDRTNGSLAQPVIRGQAQTRITNPVQNVATFFNGVYLQRSYQIDSDLLDVDRIEVVKGPQSALFGRNAFAGAISIVTRKPSVDDLRAGVEGTIGNYSRQEFRGSVSVPIAGIAGISLSSSYSKFDGTWRNDNTASAALVGGALRTKGRLNGFENKSAMGQIVIKPTDTLEIYGFWSHRKIFVESPANYQLSNNLAIRAGNALNCTPFAAPLSPARVGTNGLLCGSIPVNPVIAPGEPRAPGILVDRRAYGQDTVSNVAGATVSWDIADAINLAYQFGYTDADATNVATLSGDPVLGSASPFFAGRTLFDARGNGDIRSYTHEARASYESDSLRVMVGGFTGTVDDFSFGGSAFLAPNSTTSVLANITTPLSGYGATQRDESLGAVFGLVSLKLGDLRVTAEGRQSWETVAQQGVNAAGALFGTRFREQFSFFTPRVTVDYKPNEDTLFYASAAKGAKAGGFNVPTPTNPLTAAQQIFLPETNWTYEVGAKLALMDNKVSLEAALYHTDWNDLQGNQAVNLGQAAIIRNLAGAKVDGFELSAVLRPSKSITANFGLAYSKARFVNGTVDDTIPRALCLSLATCPTTGAYSTNIAGRAIPRAPRYQVNSGISYRKPIGDLFGSEAEFVTRIDLSLLGKQFVDNTNTAYVPDRQLVDASIGLKSGHWSARLWAKNLLDEKYVSFAFTTFAGSGAGSGVTYAPLLGDRRTLGATVSFTY